MGKIVKFCTTCDEGFAEKFAFCPNCGSGLQAFEMNPVAAETPAVVEPETPASIASSLSSEPDQMDAVIEIPAEAEPMMAAPIEAEESVLEVEPFAASDSDVMADEVVEEAVLADASEAEEVEAADAEGYDGTETVTSYNVPVSTPVYAASQAKNVDESAAPAVYTLPVANEISDFRVTVMEEKDTKTRNSLLLATFAFMMIGLFSGLVYSIFSKDLEVGSIDSDFFNAILVEQVPEIADVEVPKPRDKREAGGGGGGGGNNEPTPASRGERPPMRIDPQFAPSARAERITNPSIPIQMAIQGPVNEKLKVSDRYGVKLGGDTPSDGPGMGGGIGSGRNRGVGSGDGPGYGPGSGGGLGGGTTGGIGPGGGTGTGGVPPPPPKPVGVTQALKIIAKPKATYTDAARANNVQGVVILRVTFLASGAVGDISTVRGLPNGLTEQAIAAARRIQFEPRKVGGVGQAVTRQVEYSFTMY